MSQEFVAQALAVADKISIRLILVFGSLCQTLPKVLSLFNPT